VSELTGRIVGVTALLSLLVVGVVTSDDDDQAVTRNVAFELPVDEGGGIGLSGTDKGQRDIDKVAEVLEDVQCDPDQILLSTGSSGEWHWRCGPSLKSVLDRITSLENEMAAVENAREVAPAGPLDRQEEVDRLLAAANCSNSGLFWDCRGMNRSVIPAGANLSNANLAGSIWADLSLRTVNFSDSNLAGATFADVDLTAAEFINANLTAALFEGGGSIFRGADFTGANLAHAEFISDTEGAIGLP